jgi:hypothetical protein
VIGSVLAVIALSVSLGAVCYYCGTKAIAPASIREQAIRHEIWMQLVWLCRDEIAIQRGLLESQLSATERAHERIGLATALSVIDKKSSSAVIVAAFAKAMPEPDPTRDELVPVAELAAAIEEITTNTSTFEGIAFPAPKELVNQ